jgi:hypothetical protein
MSVTIAADVSAAYLAAIRQVLAAIAALRPRFARVATAGEAAVRCRHGRRHRNRGHSVAVVGRRPASPAATTGFQRPPLAVF